MQLYCDNNQEKATIYGAKMWCIMKYTEVETMVYPEEVGLVERVSGAVLQGTRIQMANGRQKDIAKITERDCIRTAHDTKVRVQFVKRYKQSCIYRIKISKERYLNTTAEQFLLTKNGWKRARMLIPGDEVMYYDLQLGRVFCALTSIEHFFMDEGWMYTIGLKQKAFIANGFICSDYDMQHGKTNEKEK